MRSASTLPVAALRHAVSMSADTAGASSATNRSPGNHPDDSSCSPARGWSSSQALHGLRRDENEARMLQGGGPNLQQPHKRLPAHRVCHRGQLEAAVSCCVLALAEMGSTLGSAFTHARTHERTNARTQPSIQWTETSQSRKRCNVHEGSRVCRRGRASVGARDERNGVDPLARPPREQQDQRDRPNKCRSLHHRCWKQRTSPIAKRKGHPRKLERDPLRACTVHTCCDRKNVSTAPAARGAKLRAGRRRPGRRRRGRRRRGVHGRCARKAQLLCGSILRGRASTSSLPA